MCTMPSDISKRRARRQFSEDFKQQVVRLVLDEHKSVATVARELDLVGASHEGSRRAYERPRVWKDLQEQGEAVGEKEPR